MLPYFCIQPWGKRQSVLADVASSLIPTGAIPSRSNCEPKHRNAVYLTRIQTARSEEILRLPWNLNTLVPVQPIGKPTPNGTLKWRQKIERMSPERLTALMERERLRVR